MKKTLFSLCFLTLSITVTIAVSEPEIDAESDVQRALMKLIQERTDYPPVFLTNNITKLTLVDNSTTVTLKLENLAKLESKESLAYNDTFLGYVSDSSTLTLKKNDKTLFKTSLSDINDVNANKIFWVPLKSNTQNPNVTSYQQITLGYRTEYFMNTYSVSAKDKRKIQFPRIVIKLYASSIFMDVPQSKSLDDPDNLIYRRE